MSVSAIGARQFVVQEAAEILRVLLGVDGDLLAVDDDGVLLRFDLVAERISALRGIVLEQMREHLRVNEVVDRDNFIALRAEHLSERETADTAETVNSNLNCHF